jgi:hypothetical protein
MGALGLNGTGRSLRSDDRSHSREFESVKIEIFMRRLLRAGTVPGPGKRLQYKQSGVCWMPDRRSHCFVSMALDFDIDWISAGVSKVLCFSIHHPT